MYNLESLPLKLRERIKVVGACWIWQGFSFKAGAKQGYGRVCWPTGYDEWLVHRLVYTLLVRPIPEGLTLDHLIESGVCTDTRCCNPSHVEPVTSRENTRRFAMTRTECPYGHPYSGGNLYTRLDGGRGCNICRREAVRKYKRSNRAGIANV